PPGSPGPKGPPDWTLITHGRGSFLEPDEPKSIQPAPTRKSGTARIPIGFVARLIAAHIAIPPRTVPSGGSVTVAGAATYTAHPERYAAVKSVESSIAMIRCPHEGCEMGSPIGAGRGGPDHSSA